VVVYRPDAPPVLHGGADCLDGADVLPGFGCVVRSILESGRRPADRV
jgi:hypothetical protein